MNGEGVHIGRGVTRAWTAFLLLDLDGRVRIRYGRVDIGAYEFIRSGMIISIR